MSESLEPVTITLPPAMADVLRDVCEEWVADHARFSNATRKMTGMFLSVLLQQIDEQMPKPEEPPPKPRRRCKIKP